MSTIQHRLMVDRRRVLQGAVLVAAALGLVGNAVGGFYTTWHDLASVVTNPTGE